MAITFARVAYGQRTGTAAQASSGGAAAGPQNGRAAPGRTRREHRMLGAGYTAGLPGGRCL